MPVIEISSLTHPGVEIFSTLTEAQLRNRFEPDKGLFIAESPKVIKVALDAGYEPLAFLCEHKHIYGDAAEIIERCGDIPVYTSGRELLAELTGYVLTRGVLCAMRRPVPKSMEDVCRGARRIVVIDGVVRSSEPSCGPGFNGNGFSCAVDVDGRSSGYARCVGFPYGGHGAYGQFHFHRQSRFEDRAPVGYCDGY